MCVVFCARDTHLHTQLLKHEQALERLKLSFSVVCSVYRGRRARGTLIRNKPLHPVTREADMEVPFLLKEMLS